MQIGTLILFIVLQLRTDAVDRWINMKSSLPSAFMGWVVRSHINPPWHLCVIQSQVSEQLTCAVWSTVSDVTSNKIIKLNIMWPESAREKFKPWLKKGDKERSLQCWISSVGQRYLAQVPWRMFPTHKIHIHIQHTNVCTSLSQLESLHLCTEIKVVGDTVE